MKPELRIVGPFCKHSGYSKFTRAALRTALLAGFRVQAVESDYRVRTRVYRSGRREETRLYETVDPDRPLPPCQQEELTRALGTEVSPDAPTLLIQCPPSLAEWEEFTGPRIGWTMVESDGLPLRWAASFSNLDMLLAPSRYCLDTFRAYVPYRRSELLPCPVDDRLFGPTGEAAQLPGRPGFLFFSVFSTHERKGWRRLCQAHMEEFAGESVGLLLKPTRAAEVLEMAEWCRKGGAWVQVIEEWVNDGDLASLYRACEAFALPSCEGFGLPFAEAALCGRPSVALDDGGAADIVRPDTGYPVRSYRSPCVGQMPHVYDSSQNFASCNVSDLRRALRACVNDRAARGEDARQDVMCRFTPQALAERLREIVEIGCAEHARKGP